MSRQIRDLEDELGVQLFERTGKALNLTDAGRLFLKEARAVLERTDEAVANVRVFAQAGETELHVGYTPALRAQIVSPALHAFQQAVPNPTFSTRRQNALFFGQDQPPRRLNKGTGSAKCL